jgi:serine/threonine protein kinase/tetratricopeptide (TPR) repeat protein
MVDLGPFQLQRPLGRGGMGEVWLAHHALQREAVAVKVLSPEIALQPRALRAFRREVRAAAGLDHPGIVSVFDYGEVDPAAEAASEGRLVAGSPYLVMELASHGSLTAHCGRLDWTVCRGLLLALLDALAHAHARGVIHRDLKPANVLLGQDPSGSVAVKLSDFGLAHALGSGSGERLVAGTPSSMAPEQFRAAWRDYGPWTDLYALGVVAWELLTGHLPWRAEDLEGWKRQHLRAAPPRLEAAFPLPEGLEGWLRRLLQKRTWDRFQCAADAAWALTRLEAPESTGRGPSTPTELAPDTFLVEASRAGLSALTWMELPPGDTLVPELPSSTWDESPSLGVSGGLAPREVPPLPRDWRRPRPQGLRLHGVGRGLYGLRSLQLVGRDAELDLAWGLLAQVRRERRPRALVLRGGAGVGKSRLASWIAERAQEVGSATSLFARHDRQPGPGLGLLPMVERSLHLVGLDELQLRARLEAIGRQTGSLDPQVLEARLALIRPELSQLRLDSPRERSAVLLRWLEQLGRAQLEAPSEPRATVLVLDDLQWGPEALDFARFALDQSLPLLLILTVRDDALEPGVAETLAAVQDHPRCTAHRLEALDPAASRVLVRQLLGLSGELADEVEVRTAGNPLFAVELVGDLVDRGVLELGQGGFRLGPGERLQLPDDLFQVWGPRVQALISWSGPQGELALELAAALGQQVGKAEWRGLCAEQGVGLETTRALREELARRGLIEPRPQGFAFAHGILVEALRRHAAEAGRLASHHGRCAAYLVEHSPDEVERIGRHHLQAEDWQAALEPLAQAAGLLRDRGQFVSCRLVLDRREAALQALGAGPRDLRRAEGWVLRATVDRMQGDWASFGRRIERAIAVARASGGTWLLAEAVRGKAEADRQRGRLPQARQGFIEALPIYERVGASQGAAQCIQGLGDVARQLGREDQAGDHYQRALEIYRGLHDLKGMAGIMRGLGGLARLRGDYEQAGLVIQRALELFESQGLRLGMANCLNDLGDFARYAGRTGRAEELYLRAERTYEACASYASVYPLTNLGLLYLQQGRVAEARRTVGQALDQAQAVGIGGLIGGLWLCLACCDAAEGRWRDFDAALPRAIDQLRRSAEFDPDNVLPAEQAAEHCLRAGQTERAGACLQLAREQLIGLGEHQAAAVLDRRLAELR